MSSLASELEATNQKTETRCTNIRKEVSKALTEQRQLLTVQSEAMCKKMDSVAAKVVALPVLRLSVCLLCPHGMSTRTLSSNEVETAQAPCIYVCSSCGPSKVKGKAW